VGEVFNIGNGEEITIRELAERIRTMTASRSPIVTVPYDVAYERGFEDMPRRVPDILDVIAVEVEFGRTSAADGAAPAAVLKRVRSIIRKALPKAEEVISYQIPAYKLNGGTVIYFAGWKQHYSLYPATGRLVAVFRDDLAPYEVSKGTIRFPLAEPIPTKLIGSIAKFRAKEVSDREKAKAAAPRRG